MESYNSYCQIQNLDYHYVYTLKWSFIKTIKFVTWCFGFKLEEWSQSSINYFDKLRYPCLMFHLFEVTLLKHPITIPEMFCVKTLNNRYLKKLKHFQIRLAGMLTKKDIMIHSSLIFHKNKICLSFDAKQ